MVATAFVLITVTAPLDNWQAVRAKIDKIDGVKETHPLFGEIDILVKVEASDYDSISLIVTKKIRSIEGIATSKTMIRVPGM